MLWMFAQGRIAGCTGRSSEKVEEMRIFAFDHTRPNCRQHDHVLSRTTVTMAPKRPSPTAKGRSNQPSPPTISPKPRPKLTSDDLKTLASLMRTQFGWSEDPRFHQLDGTQAQLEGVDMVIQAPTGSGKTAIAAGPHVWPSSKGKTTIMVCPLLALEHEMVCTAHAVYFDLYFTR